MTFQCRHVTPFWKNGKYSNSPEMFSFEEKRKRKTPKNANRNALQNGHLRLIFHFYYLNTKISILLKSMHWSSKVYIQQGNMYHKDIYQRPATKRRNITPQCRSIAVKDNLDDFIFNDFLALLIVVRQNKWFRGNLGAKLDKIGVLSREIFNFWIWHYLTWTWPWPLFSAWSTLIW